MTKQEQAKEFNRRRNLTGVEVVYLFTKRTASYHLKYCGKDYGSKTEVSKRKKVVDTLYILPNIDCNDLKCGRCHKCYEEYIAAKMNGELD